MKGKTLVRLLGVLALAIGLVAVGAPANAAIPGAERQALIDLYNATNGGGWTDNTGWLGAAGTECDWHGITCDGGETTVISIGLANNNLVGTLPGSIGDLTDLTMLYLYRNDLSGSIPPSIGNLSKLEQLKMGWNNLSGPIPGEVGDLASLKMLDLTSNQLSGALPATLAGLSALEQLLLHANKLDGALPAWLGGLTALRYIDLASNQLSGPIPAEMGNLSNARYVSLGFNPLGGEIPASLGGLTSLINLNLEADQLTGPIPSELGNLAGLEWLVLSYNPLGGEIPAFFGNLSALQALRLNGCQLSGAIPSELGNLANLTHLELISNDLTGGIPAFLGKLPKLKLLMLGRNWLTGRIPASLGNLNALETLTLEENALVGEIPASLMSLVNLEDGSLRLTYNGLWTDDAALAAFLDAKQFGGDWRSTQTVAPTGVVATAGSASSVTVSWMPISYTGDAGGYRVSYAPGSGGGYTYVGRTTDKSASSMEISGLTPGGYFIIVQAETDAHDWQKNTVRSEPGQRVWVSTSGGTPPGPSQQVISLIANLDGKHGSHWMSDVKITNPFSETIQVVLKGTPHDTSGSGADPSITRVLQPGETLGIEDVYGAIFGGQAQGKARLLVIATDLGGGTYAVPITTSNIYNLDDGGGEFQTYGPATRTDRLYPAGTRLCDNTLKGSGERYNFDVLAGNAGATILYTYRDSNGDDLRTATVDYKPAATRQHVGAEKLFGLSELASNSSIVAEIQAGSAVVRGTPTNNITNDSRSQPWQVVGR